MKAQRNMVHLRNQDLLKLPKVEKVFTVVFQHAQVPFITVKMRKLVLAFSNFLKNRVGIERGNVS